MMFYFNDSDIEKKLDELIAISGDNGASNVSKKLRLKLSNNHRHKCCLVMLTYRTSQNNELTILER